MNVIDKLRLLYQQDRYNSTSERCWDCEHWESYCFDERDADAWCGIDDSWEETMHWEKNCIKFRPKVKE